MSYSPNKLLYNGEVLLSKSLCTGENQSPLQMYQYGYPFPLLPNLNFLPENVSTIAISEAACSPSTPITLDNSRKRIQTSLPVEVIDLVDESETNGNMQGKNIGFSQPGSHEFAELFSRSVMSSQVVSPQQQGDENNAVKLSEEASFQLLETEEHGKGEMQGIDLNKTPQQKPKRKKHRPKVLREGKPKPARTPKPVTPMPVTPKPARNKEGSTGKRKYVRKKKVLDSSSGPSCTPCENVDHPDSGSRSKNVKRCLNFNAEEPQEIHGFLESSVISTHYPPLAQNTRVSSSIVPPAQRREVVVENSMARAASTPNSSVNQFSRDQYIRIPGTPAPSSQPLRRETMRTNHTLNGYIRVVKSTAPSQQTSRREIIHENLKQLARKNDSRNTSGSNFARLPEVGQKSELNFNSTSNMVLQGAKRNYNLVDGEDISNYINFMNGDKEINCVSKGHHAYFHESHKKKRTEKEHNELVSNAASVTCNPSNSLKTNLMVANSSEVFNFAHMESPISSSRNMTMVVPENCRDFTFADAQRLMAREKLRASEHMLSFNQNDRGPENTLQAPVMVGISNSVRTTKDESLSTPVKPSRRVKKDRCLPHGKSDLLTTAKDMSISTPLKPSGLTSTECSQPSTPAQVNRYTSSPPSGVHGTQISKESHFIKNQVKVKTKSCEQNNFSRPMPSNTKQVYPREGKVASCSNDPCQGQRFDQVTTLPSGNFKGKNPNPRVSSLQNCQSSIKFKESPNGIHVSGAIFLPGDPLDDIVQKLRCLTINRSHEKVAVEATNSLVPYGGGGSMMVPYEGPFDPTKKRRSRAKVDLDPETERVWKLLMGKECSDEGMDINKEKWWEEERRIFRGRVDSFIARMHLVQGDRRFSQWKGSVVDSVVGVFLTQNVSDHLSSSAFMSVAARFPCKPKGNNNNLYTEKTSSYAEQQDGGVISCDRNMWETNMLGHDLCNQGPSGIPEVTSLAGELITGNIEPLQRNTTGTLLDDSKNKQDLRERDLESGHKALGGASIAESEDRRSVEDALSSQNSVVSSQNSSEDLVHRGEQIILRPSSQSDPETLANDMNNYLDIPTSFLELLQMAETTKLQEFYIHGNERIPSTEFSGAAYKSSCLDTDSITCTSNQANYFEGECMPMYGSKHQHQGTQYGFLGLSCAPSISYGIQNPSNSNLMACRNPSTSGEEIILQSPLTDTGMNTAYNTEVMDRKCSPFAESSAEIKSQHDFMHSFYSSSCVQSYLPSRLTTMQTANGLRDETNSNVPLTAAGISRTIDINILDRDCELLVGNSTLSQSHDGLRSLSYSSSPYYSLHNLSNFNPTMVGVVNAAREDTYCIPSTASETYTTNKTKMMAGCFPSVEESTEESIPQSLLFASKTKPALDTSATISNHFLQPSTSSEVYCDKNGFCCSNLAKEQTEISSGKVTSNKFSALRNEHAAMFQQKESGAEFQVKNTDQATRNEEGLQNGRTDKSCLNFHDDSRRTSKALEAIESNLKVDTCSSQKVSAASTGNTSKTKKITSEAEKQKAYDWDSLRKQTCQSNAKKERNVDAMDSVDWEEVRCADVSQISQTIRERGMNNMLAERIKEFLNRLVKDHGSIDLEWLRDAPPDTVKDYLLSIRGLGLKSVECVRLLTLHHLAFPVDTNVGRICVRLGWVPLQPLPESLQLHLLEMYPVLETIQKYLWPRLCKLDQRTLYELHYQLITFGKVFCTKSKPNCNACPMRGECKHFASAFASARFALPGPEERGLVRSTAPVTSGTSHNSVYNPAPPPQLVGTTLPLERSVFNNCEPIIEEPTTPEPEFLENSESAIEDAFDEDPEEIPTIKLNLEKFTKNIQNYVTENNMELQDGEMSNALVAISAEAASIPMPKLKDMSRLRTEHLVYELPDSHPLLEGLDKRERDDPSSYLLAIWSPGETAQSTDLPTKGCDSQDIGKLCDKKTCFACNSIREAQSQTVRATLLIPCRTAMRGSFPLNGTYFQVNEVFADHDSSRNPINVPREWIWNLPRRTVYFGTSIPTIFKGLTTEGIQYCFWRGFVCVRGFDRKTRAPKPLYARLHFPASKAPRNRQAAAAAAREEE